MKLAIVIVAAFVSSQAFAETKPAPHAPPPAVATTPTITPNPSGRINSALPAQPPVAKQYVAPADTRPAAPVQHLRPVVVPSPVHTSTINKNPTGDRDVQRGIDRCKTAPCR